MAIILDNKDAKSPSVFRPAALLREARRQKAIPAVDVPSVCILDPDGDIVRRLRGDGRSKPFEGWPCYHTQLDVFDLASRTVGIIGCAVGAPFAVLVAEELFASGCQLLLSLASAGQIVAAGTPPYFVIIERALRDEGTSYHYAPPSEYGVAEPRLVQAAADAIRAAGLLAIIGPSWTTDAPFRETTEAIEAACRRGILAVEMEAAALYTFARSTGAKVLCLANVTNTMGQTEKDFEKGTRTELPTPFAFLKRWLGHSCPQPNLGRTLTLDETTALLDWFEGPTDARDARLRLTSSRSRGCAPVGLARRARRGPPGGYPSRQRPEREHRAQCVPSHV
jgi:uridine phosphorylase